MDYKTFKQDLVYCIKKLIKDGKQLSLDGGDHLDIVDGNFVLDGNFFCPLESLILVKGIKPSSDHLNYNLKIFDIIEKNLSITFEDVCSFYNGFQAVNVTENDFYKVGSYIREKFISPENMLPPILLKQFEFDLKSRDLERAFIISSDRKGTSVIEVEYSKLSVLEDPSLLGIKDGEWKARIESPASTIEKQPDGKMIKSIFCWHAFYKTSDEALTEISKSLYWQIMRAKRKQLTDDSDVILEVLQEEIDEALSKIKIINL